MLSHKNIQTISKKAGYVLFIVVITLVLSEIGLRALGFGVEKAPKISFQFKPQNCFNTDSVWGINLRPGQYQVTINDGLTYQVTHNNKGERICSDTMFSQTLPEWIFLGCSMTYGMGVDDSCTYPYVLQKKMPQKIMRNLAIPGTGGLHQYLRLKKFLEQEKNPEAVFFSYMDFHDSRNVFSTATADVIGIGTSSNKRPPGSPFWGYAYARKKADSYQIKYKNLSIKRSKLPGVKYLALSNTIQQLIDKNSDSKLNMEDVSRHYLIQSRDLCQERNISFAVVLMRSGGANDSMRKFCEDNKIRTIDISVDFTNPAMTNQPFDFHPSPMAHRSMAAKFEAQLLERPLK